MVDSSNLSGPTRYENGVWQRCQTPFSILGAGRLPLPSLAHGRRPTLKLIGPIRQVMVQGLDKVDQLLTLTMAAYNLTRLRTLAQLHPQCAQ